MPSQSRSNESSIPFLARRGFRIELTATFFFSIGLACVEGGVISSFAKKTFEGVTPWLNLAVGLLGCAPEIANVISFVWTQWSHGRPKVWFVNMLQVGTIASIAAVAFVPVSAPGLWMLAALVLLARTFWSGILTIRPTIWRANYSREHRARLVGRISTTQVLVVAVMGILIGIALNQRAENFRWVTLTGAATACVAALLYGRVRMRREKNVVKEESQTPTNVMAPWRGLITVWHVLRKDRLYAKFMLWMFVLGFGNIMLMPTLVLTLRDDFHADYLTSILITSSIPALVVPLAIPAWARFLDRAHVIRFRSVHSWAFVFAQVVFAVGTRLQSIELLYVGAVALGVGFAGGSLAWNLGHVDFAPPKQTSQYMATHVTLNGLRGILAPLAAVGLYGVLSRIEGVNAAAWVLDVSCVLCIAGAVGFVLMRRDFSAAPVQRHA